MNEVNIKMDIKTSRRQWGYSDVRGTSVSGIGENKYQHRDRRSGYKLYKTHKLFLITLLATHDIMFPRKRFGFCNSLTRYLVTSHN